jgi:hypothetical protein
LDVHEEFIQVPDVSLPSLLMPESLSEAWTELPTPLPDGLLRNHDSSLGEKFLNISETQGETVIQPDSVTDDLRGDRDPR